MCPNDKQFKALSPSYPHNSIAASKALNKLTAVGLPTFDGIVFSAIHITKKSPDGDFCVISAVRELGEQKSTNVDFFRTNR